MIALRNEMNSRFESLEGQVNSRFESLEGQVNSRFESKPGEQPINQLLILVGGSWITIMAGMLAIFFGKS